MVVSDAAALVIFGLAATAGSFLVLGWNLRWDSTLARVQARLASQRRAPAAGADAPRREAPELALGEGAR
jgi:hypothetical protein